MDPGLNVDAVRFADLGRIADLDGDGDLDVLAKPYSWEAPRLDVFLNEGTR